ncbi:hypothetical protein AMTRI_Chr03g54060 [Amborella trichopoda]
MAGVCSSDQKTRWPELVGTKKQFAVHTIEKENPNVHAQVVPPGFYIPPDIRCWRVLVWINEHDIVTRIPIVG